jgi:hypothetical protein
VLLNARCPRWHEVLFVARSRLKLQVVLDAKILVLRHRARISSRKPAIKQFGDSAFGNFARGGA